MSVKSRAAVKLAAKTGGKAVPGVGQAIMVIEGTPVALEEGSKAYTIYMRGMKKVKKLQEQGKRVAATKAYYTTQMKVQAALMKGAGRTAVTAFVAQEAADSILRNPQTELLTWHYRAAPPGSAHAHEWHAKIPGGYYAVASGGTAGTKAFLHGWHDGPLSMKALTSWHRSPRQARAAAEEYFAKNYPLLALSLTKGNPRLPSETLLARQGLPLAPKHIQKQFNPRWDEQWAGQFNNVYVLPNGLYVRWDEDAGTYVGPALGEQFVVFTEERLDGIEFIDPYKPGFTLKLRRAGMAKTNPSDPDVYRFLQGHGAAALVGREIQHYNGTGFRVVAVHGDIIELEDWNDNIKRKPLKAFYRFTVLHDYETEGNPRSKHSVEQRRRTRKSKKRRRRRTSSGEDTGASDYMSRKRPAGSGKHPSKPKSKRPWRSRANPMMSDTQRYQDVLAHLRALQWVYWTAHWTAAGPTYYGDHLLLQRLYEGEGGGPDIQNEIDGFGERMVVFFGPGSVSPSLIIDRVKSLTDKAMKSSDGPFEALLAMEMELQGAIRRAWRANQDSGQFMSLGIDDLLMSLANEREGAIYLLRRRLGGLQPMAGQHRQQQAQRTAPSVPPNMRTIAPYIELDESMTPKPLPKMPVRKPIKPKRLTANPKRRRRRRR